MLKGYIIEKTLRRYILDIVTLQAARAAAKKDGNAAYGPGGSAGNLSRSDLNQLLSKQPAPPVNLIAHTQSGHGFTVATNGTPTSNLNDTTDPMLGTQSVSLTTSTTAEVDAFRRDIAVDMTNKGFVVYLKLGTQTTGIGKIDIQLPSGDGNYTGIIAGGAAYTSEQQYAKDGEWMRWFVPFSAISAGFRGGSSGTTMSRSAITSVRVRIYNLAGQQVNAVIAGVGTYPEPATLFPNGVVSFTYDDTGNSQFNAARVHLDKYGFRGTLYPILDRIDTSGYLTSAQIKHLHDRLGWEIGAHASSVSSHALGLTGMTSSQRITELKTLRDWQVANGYADGSTFAYPRGAFDSASMLDVSRYWVAARTVYGHCPEIVGTPYPYRLRCVNPSGFTLAQMKTLVDVAKQGRCWTIFCFHNLPSTATDPVTDWALADHLALVDYIAASSVPVLPVSEVMRVGQPI